MCGIFGMVDARRQPDDSLRLAEQLQRHRGPDAQARRVWELGSWHVGIAHQRLAILDLSDAGVQPMSRDGGRSWIAFNGEIYNFLELRCELEKAGLRFSTRTDTEVILAAIETWGLDEALRRFNGMWAFAWLDTVSRRMVLARDRFGVKPCYYFSESRCFVFASEIKAILATACRRFPVDADVVSAYLGQLQVDWGDATFFRGVRKVPAGHYVALSLTTERLEPSLVKYWDLSSADAAPQSDLSGCVEEVRALLDDAVRIRLRSDVPVGVLLSGGLDSSAVAASAHAALDGGGNLALIGAVSDDPETDESAYMRLVARHIGRPLEEVHLGLDRSQILGLVRKVTWHNDEPIGSFSCVAQYLLMERARECGVTVLLSGQGADETFCGYLKYVGFHVQALVRGGHRGRAALTLYGYMRRGTVLRQLRWAEAGRYLPDHLKPRLPPLMGRSLKGCSPLRLGLGDEESLQERQIRDIERFSIPALTHWEDRNSMAWSREVRNPFLDYRLVARAVSLPAEFKLAQGWTKFALRRAVADRLPAEICWRKDKRGFTTPEATWLRGELKPAIVRLIEGESRAVARGLVDRDGLAARYNRFLGSRGGVMSRELFQCLSLESWLESFEPHLEDSAAA